MQIAKTVIRLSGCQADRSRCWVHVIWLVLSCCGSLIWLDVEWVRCRLYRMFRNFVVIIIITLFQENNNECQSIIWSSKADIHAFVNYKTMKIIYSITEHVRSLYIEHAVSGLPNPTHLEGEVRFIQTQDQQVLSHIDINWTHTV